MSLPDIRRDLSGAVLFSVHRNPLHRNKLTQEPVVRALRLTAFAVLAVACAKEGVNNSSTASSTASSGGAVDLTGAGATFPYPIYSKWVSDYAQRTGVK